MNFCTVLTPEPGYRQICSWGAPATKCVDSRRRFQCVFLLSQCFIRATAGSAVVALWASIWWSARLLHLATAFYCFRDCSISLASRSDNCCPASLCSRSLCLVGSVACTWPGSIFRLATASTGLLKGPVRSFGGSGRCPARFRLWSTIAPPVHKLEVKSGSPSCCCQLVDLI